MFRRDRAIDKSFSKADRDAMLAFISRPTKSSDHDADARLCRKVESVAGIRKANLTSRRTHTRLETE